MKIRIGHAVGVRTVAFVFLALTARPASAGPPFRTDDPEAVEYKHAEFYIFATDPDRGRSHRCSARVRIQLRHP